MFEIHSPASFAPSSPSCLLERVRRQSPFRRLRYYAKTCWLFIADDVKTIILPCSTFSLITSPRLETSRIPLVIFWISIHLFLCDVSNQSVSRLEDLANKPYRPIASGRISERSARHLLVFLYIFCTLLSAALSQFWVSFTLGMLALAYNTYEMSQNWMAKNILNAAAYVCFEYGGTALAGDELDHTAYTALFLSFFTIITTIHCQDFRDIEGDRLSGRITLPIQFGQTASRALFSFFVIFWSILIPHVWDMAFLWRSVYFLSGLYLGVCVFRRRTVEEDKRSYKLYNFWIAAIHFAVINARR